MQRNCHAGPLVSALPFATGRLHSHSRENAGHARKLSTGIFWLDTCVGGAIHRPPAARSPKGVHNPSCTRKKLYKPIKHLGRGWEALITLSASRVRSSDRVKQARFGGTIRAGPALVLWRRNPRAQTRFGNEGKTV